MRVTIIANIVTCTQIVLRYDKSIFQQQRNVDIAK
jgi:hypothetical protein